MTSYLAPGRRKITVALPGDLLSRLDSIVPQRARSRFIAEAIEERVAIAEQRAAIEEAAGIWKDENHPEMLTDKDIDLWIRELRSTWVLTEITDNE